MDNIICPVHYSIGDTKLMSSAICFVNVISLFSNLGFFFQNVECLHLQWIKFKMTYIVFT